MPSPENLVQRLNAHNAGIHFNAWLGIEVLNASAQGVEMRVPWRPTVAVAPPSTCRLTSFAALPMAR